MILIDMINQRDATLTRLDKLSVWYVSDLDDDGRKREVVFF